MNVRLPLRDPNAPVGAIARASAESPDLKVSFEFFPPNRFENESAQQSVRTSFAELVRKRVCATKFSNLFRFQHSSAELVRKGVCATKFSNLFRRIGSMTC